MPGTNTGFKEKSSFGYKVDYDSITTYQDYSKIATNSNTGGYMFYNPQSETWEVSTALPFARGSVGSVVFRGVADDLDASSDLRYSSTILYAPNVQTSFVSGLLTPVLPSHAANKAYVDGLVGANTTFWRIREADNNNMLYSYTPDGGSTFVDVVELEVPES